jgi:hypothetical protein
MSALPLKAEIKIKVLVLASITTGPWRIPALAEAVIGPRFARTYWLAPRNDET